jgi:hypothetical protein
MSDDGGRVFFDTPDPLVSRDANGATDVYEWTPSGVALISSGRSHDGSFLLDNGPNGNDVFFTTTEGLDPGDRDESYDVYDARVGGGFKKVDQAAPCVDDSCQGALSKAPPTPASGSTVFSGAGNQHLTRPDATPTKAKLKLTSRRVIGSTLKVTATITGPGRVSVTGNGLRSLTKSYAESGTFAVKVPLTAKAKRALKAKHRLKLSVRVGLHRSSGRRRLSRSSSPPRPRESSCPGVSPCVPVSPSPAVAAACSPLGWR